MFKASPYRRAEPCGGSRPGCASSPEETTAERRLTLQESVNRGIDLTIGNLGLFRRYGATPPRSAWPSLCGADPCWVIEYEQGPLEAPSVAKPVQAVLCRSVDNKRLSISEALTERGSDRRCHYQAIRDRQGVLRSCPGRMVRAMTQMTKDFENLTRSALAFFKLASIRLMLRRICSI